MDILKEIEQQVNSIKKVDNPTYLGAIFTHIERAEFYYSKGQTDASYFNDVIYRSNQAYEGALKESYRILAGKTEKELHKKTPNDIEKFFEENEIFRNRVMQLFKNYRQEWRNKSTHDHKLFFDENEAFIAMTSVTSFVHLLLKQIQEKIAFISQEIKLKDEKEFSERIVKIAATKDKKPADKLVDMIIEFSKQNSEQIYGNKQNTREIEIMGLFHAYIEAAGKYVTAQREPQFHVGNSGIRPDFLIRINEESVVLEFKRMSKMGSYSTNAINQILTYMQAANTTNGVIYFANFNEPNPEPNVTKTEVMFNHNRYEIITVTT